MTTRNTATRDQHRRTIRRTKPPCAICGGEIDYTLPTPHPDSFEVDHIVALHNGGTDTLDNKQASHRRCNRAKWHTVERDVLLICGPPGAGKTTAAQTSGLTVFDVDDPQWGGSERLFRTALQHVATQADARAAVIRSAATLAARQTAADLCRATRLVVLETDVKTCVQRIRQRNRTDRQSIRVQIAAAQDWWAKYEPGAVTLARNDGTTGPRLYVTTRAW